MRFFHFPSDRQVVKICIESIDFTELILFDETVSSPLKGGDAVSNAKS